MADLNQESQPGPSTQASESAESAPQGVDKASSWRRLSPVAVAALGVVYGDIGTSPLYAFKECFHIPHGVPPTRENVLGVLSLIIWSLIIVVSVKYLLFILRADNRGEGGIIALVALLNPWRAAPGTKRNILMLLGLFGAALLYGDGTITPAISVLSAVEGLSFAAPAFSGYVVPIAVVILFGLFAFQSRGTGTVGALFGPVMLAWFVVLALLGVGSVVDAPQVLGAVSPVHGLRFLFANGIIGLVVLGTVFLTVTGAEALYADMGHFGRRPIRVAWFAVVLPALLLNYLGQGAYVLANPLNAAHPFYGLAPQWAIYPLVGLATLATVIASQAVISGAFSLTGQAVQLGQLPRLKIVQTAPDQMGQIYVPVVNWALMAATIALVLGFQSSSGLASAYGIAVSTDMVITTVLALFVAVRWGWNPVLASLLAAAFLIVDLAFFSANLFKIADGGWYPLLIAALVFSIMAIWRKGLRRLGALTLAGREPLDAFLKRTRAHPPQRIPGTAVFMTSNSWETPPLLLHNLTHNQVLHERVVLATVFTEDAPRVPTADRLRIEELPLGFYRLSVHYGFMQSPNIPVALRLCEKLGVEIDLDRTTFFLGHEDVIVRKQSPAFDALRTRLFSFMWRNATRATAYYNIPSGRVVAMALQVEM